MKFRIRNTQDAAMWQSCEQAYRQHLEQFPKSSNKCLWKFFYWDFFHDGIIESIQVQSDLRTVTMRILCPNIKRFTSDTDYEYISAKFRCTFRDVVRLDIEDTSPRKWWEEREDPAVFLCGEINTSPLLSEINLKKRDVKEADLPFCSLLIEIDCYNTVIILEMVFSQVDVIPDEPLAFSLMEADKQFEVPIYRPDASGPDCRAELPPP